MLSKTSTIIAIFVLLLLTYFVYLLHKVVNKKEKFEDKEQVDDKDEKDDNDEKDKKQTSKKETYADKELDMNLFIINTFEDVHKRKIQTDELKKFSSLFMDGDLSKKEMKNKIENYKNENFNDDSDGSSWNELLETSKKMTSLIEKLSKQGGSKKVESFRNSPLPFFDEKKYMTL
jgi:Na+-transporting methylmalonyl-CoA/oxaloacetate decarboxylase gamma subunit